MDRTQTNTDSRAPLRATPVLERLLGRLGRKLSAQIWMHGLGTLLACLALWLAFAFFADWALHVPRGVRWFHLAVLAALPLVLMWREIVRHLRRRPDRSGLALLVERAHPELHELLVTAVQLQTRPPSDAAPELVGNVLQEADQRAGRIELARVLRERPQRVRLVAGLALAGTVAAASWLNPEYAGIFYARLFGSSVPWPQRTHLQLELATTLEHAQVRETESGLEAKVARGTDVPLVVRALGAQPEEVTLHFSGGSQVVLGAGADGTFRTLLRSCQEDLTLSATGGDDRDETPQLAILVLDPPDIAGLAVRIVPPAYTAQAPRVEFDRDVQVLAGSEIEVVILPQPPDARGLVRILPADETRELATRPFPAAEDPAHPLENEGDVAAEGRIEARTGLGFELTATQSLRYRFELVDRSGLSNPDPGLFAIEVATDERPQVEVLAPGRTDVETVAGGALRLSLRASDDFGLASLAWRSRSSGREERSSTWSELEMRPAALPVRGDEVQRGVAMSATTRLDVTALVPEGAAVADGDLYEIELQAADNRPRAADGAFDPSGVGTCPPVRVRVVSDDEFLRRLQERLAKVRTDVAELEELQRQRITRTRDVLAAIESDQLGSTASELAALLVGQRRVQGDADSVLREFAGALESVLYARIDEKAAGLLEELDAGLARSSGKGFPIEAWKGLADSVRAGRQLAQGLSGQLVGLFDLSLVISADDVPQAVEALDRASRKTELGDVHAELTAALQRQETAHQHLTDLLDKLAEWDNFQSILSLTRDILNRQKTVRDRTVEMTSPEKRK